MIYGRCLARVDRLLPFRSVLGIPRFFDKTLSTDVSSYLAVGTTRGISNLRVSQDRKPRHFESSTPNATTRNWIRSGNQEELVEISHQKRDSPRSLGPDAILNSVIRKIRDFVHYLLPTGYPDSVTTSYPGYALWSNFGSMVSSAGGVISIQSLLFAVGVGSASLPLGAAFNWILKDGVGQIGGVLYASVIGNRFDVDPKKWRFVAAVTLDLSTYVEIITPLFPGMFLPLAAAANVGKNISWLSSAATRASIHQALQTRANLADITGKSGSQMMTASTLGTILGMGISSIVGTDPMYLIGVFSVLSSIHLGSVYMSMKSVALPTLSPCRMELALLPYLLTRSMSNSEAGSSQKSDAESAISSEFSTLPGSAIAKSLEPTVEESIFSPQQVSKIEGILHPYLFPSYWYKRQSPTKTESFSETIPRITKPQAQSLSGLFDTLDPRKCHRMYSIPRHNYISIRVNPDIHLAPRDFPKFLGDAVDYQHTCVAKEMHGSGTSTYSDAEDDHSKRFEPQAGDHDKSSADKKLKNVETHSVKDGFRANSCLGDVGVVKKSPAMYVLCPLVIDRDGSWLTRKFTNLTSKNPTLRKLLVFLPERKGLHGSEYDLNDRTMENRDHSVKEIGIFYTKSATNRDVLRGYVHALLLRRKIQISDKETISTHDFRRMSLEASTLLDQDLDTLVSMLEKEGWWTTQPVLERNIDARISVHCEKVT